MQVSEAESTSHRVENLVEQVGDRLVRAFQLLALFILGATIVWSAAGAYWEMINAGRADLHDILLLFIYLELGAMVGIYFQTDELPVEFLLYVAVTVITRSLVEVETLDDLRIVILAVSVLILASAVLMLRYAAKKFRGKSGRSAATEVTDLPE